MVIIGAAACGVTEPPFVATFLLLVELIYVLNTSCCVQRLHECSLRMQYDGSLLPRLVLVTYVICCSPLCHEHDSWS